MKIYGEFSTKEQWKIISRKEEDAMKKPNKAVVAKFSVLKGVRPQLTSMRMTTLRCAGECTCRCCK
jgi:hypothetical protein